MLILVLPPSRKRFAEETLRELGGVERLTCSHARHSVGRNANGGLTLVYGELQPNLQRRNYSAQGMPFSITR